MTPPSDIQTDRQRTGDPTGLHRVLDDGVVLPQAAQRLDTRAELWPDEVRVRVERLNLDAASFRQLERAHTTYGETDGDAVRAEVLDIVATRGKMQNPVTGSGGMLVGTVEEVGPESPLGLAGRRQGRHPGQPHPHPARHRGRPGRLGRPQRAGAVRRLRRALRSLDRRRHPRRPRPRPLAQRDGRLRRPRADRTRRGGVRRPRHESPVVAVIGGAGKSGSLSLAAARAAGAARTIGVVPHAGEHDLLTGAGIADVVTIADARDPIALRDAVTEAGGPADVTVVCVDVPGCEGGAILATAEGGTVIFFSMATSFSAAALGAEGLGRRRADARRQRLRPRPRGLRHGAAARRRRRARPLRAEALMADAKKPASSASTGPTYAARARSPARSASRSSTSPPSTRPSASSGPRCAWPASAARTPTARRGSTGSPTPYAPTSGSSTASASRSGTRCCAARATTC